MSLAPERRGIPLRAVVPNAVTALALCSGLTGIRFGISGDWDKAVMFVAFAAVLDGMDGRIARALKGQSRFGAELDSLSDVIAFGVSPAIIIHLWSLQHLPRFGWVFALAYAVCMALRLARFNARIDVEDQPHKSAGFLTGVPAPAGARAPAPPHFSVAGERPTVGMAERLPAGRALDRLHRLPGDFERRHFLLGLAQAAAQRAAGGDRRHRHPGRRALSAPFETLSVAALLYVAMIPVSVLSYAKVKRLRARLAAAVPPLAEPVPALLARRPARRRRSPPNAPSA